MRLAIYCITNIACRVIIEDHLKEMGVEYNFESATELQARISEEQHTELNAKLSRFGIEVALHEPNDLVEQIKRAVIELVNSDKEAPNINLSEYLSKKFNYSYGHLTAIFSEATYTSIAHFTIMQKIERIKELLLMENLTLTEI